MDCLSRGPATGVSVRCMALITDTGTCLYMFDNDAPFQIVILEECMRGDCDVPQLIRFEKPAIVLLFSSWPVEDSHSPQEGGKATLIDAAVTTYNSS